MRPTQSSFSVPVAFHFFKNRRRGMRRKVKRCILLFFAISVSMFLFSCSKDVPQTDIRIAVIDTGISSAAIDPSSIDEGENLISPGEGTEDMHGHGTAVAAIIVGSETAQVDGLCEDAVLIPIVWTTVDEADNVVSGDAQMIARAIRDAVDKYSCRIINVSLGTDTATDELWEAVKYASRKGALIVASAGNRYFDSPERVYFPGGYDEVLCVGAADADGNVSEFSEKNDTVDIYAPGEDLRLVTVRGTKIRGEGTSYAAAYVSGAAARIWQQDPGLTCDEVRKELLKCADERDGAVILDPIKVDSRLAAE